jgi:uncharacterized membrane protein YeaQ/YmgE (transglycosylase-associated protein family)
MITARSDVSEGTRVEKESESRYEHWHHWPVNWTAVWVGVLASLAVALIIGLIGVAVGAQQFTPEHRVVDLHKVNLIALIFSVCGAFFAFVVGGWVTGKIAGILHAEDATLHGAITWLTAVPLLLVLISLGAGNFLGGWNAGLAGTPAWASSASTPFDRPEAPGTNADAEQWTQYRKDLADYNQNLRQWREDTPKATRNSALGAVTALLLGLVGSVVGGWMASGEPMSLTYRRAARPQPQANRITV